MRIDKYRFFNYLKILLIQATIFNNVIIGIIKFFDFVLLCIFRYSASPERLENRSETKFETSSEIVNDETRK